MTAVTSIDESLGYSLGMTRITLQIRWPSLQAGGCHVSVRHGEASSSCWAQWPQLKEKLRDALNFSEADLVKIEHDLSANGLTSRTHVTATPAQVRALGLQWP